MLYDIARTKLYDSRSMASTQLVLIPLQVLQYATKQYTNSCYFWSRQSRSDKSVLQASARYLRPDSRPLQGWKVLDINLILISSAKQISDCVLFAYLLSLFALLFKYSWFSIATILPSTIKIDLVSNKKSEH